MDKEKRHLNEFLKPRELAEIINVTPECIRTWIFRGQIPVRRFGKAVRIPREAAQKIIEEGLDSLTQVRDGNPPVEETVES